MKKVETKKKNKGKKRLEKGKPSWRLVTAACSREDATCRATRDRSYKSLHKAISSLRKKTGEMEGERCKKATRRLISILKIDI